MRSPSPSVRDLLPADAGTGYPIEYVLARIPARRARLTSDWRVMIGARDEPAMSDERIWGALVSELAWLRRQLPPELRSKLDPVFGLFELKTLILVLRNQSIDRYAEADRLLARSLLDPDVLDRIARRWDAADLARLEDRLVQEYLDAAAAAPLHPVIRAFFGAFIDARNLVIAHKHLRWDLAADAPWIRGGHIPPEQWRALLARRDTAALAAITARLTGGPAPIGTAVAASLEVSLLSALGRLIAGLHRGDGAVAMILDYAWRVYIEARNRSLLHHAGDLGAARLEQELIA